ncbi:hypothetical protein M514_17698 [Trichuris suis]|uniref:Uncharacterized protein n=1 Tax=Trichuris suis TaxID=68888 RepID=A0A085NKV0_9BILA|nr:hypothetical protein M514_17698 [Trichuris suis]
MTTPKYWCLWLSQKRGKPISDQAPWLLQTFPVCLLCLPLVFTSWRAVLSEEAHPQRNSDSVACSKPISMDLMNYRSIRSPLCCENESSNLIRRHSESWNEIEDESFFFLSKIRNSEPMAPLHDFGATPWHANQKR